PHRRAAPHRRKLLAHRAPGGAGGVARGGLASGLAWGGLARGSLARGGVGAPALAAGGILSALAPLAMRVAPSRRLARSGRGRRHHHVAVEARPLLVVERARERLPRGLDPVQGPQRPVRPPPPPPPPPPPRRAP